MINNENFLVTPTLKTVREKLGLSAKDLGSYHGLTEKDILKIENGLTIPPPALKAHLDNLINMYELTNERHKALARTSESFSHYYEILISKVLSEKEFSGDKDHRRCRYCEKAAPEVRFKNKSHAIPELIGNRNFIAYDECDTCNKIFSSLETSLGDFTYLERVISKTLGKNGFPHFKRKNDIGIAPQVAGPTEVHFTENSSSITIDEKNRCIIFNAKNSFIPRDVFKMFTKMALAIMPEEKLPEFKTTSSWIRGLETNIDQYSDATMFHAYTTLVPGPKPYGDYVRCTLFQRRNPLDYVPYMIFFVAFTNFSFQIPVLFSANDAYLSGKSFLLQRYIEPLSKESIYGYSKFDTYDFSSLDKKAYERTVTLSYAHGEKITIPPDKALEILGDRKPLYK